MARDIVDDRFLGALHVRALSRSGLVHDPVVEHTAFQAGTLDALMAGRFDGDATLGDLLAHGDLGIGTVQHLAGELVVLDGQAFVVDADGVVEVADHSMRTPFAVVIAFSPVLHRDLTGPMDLAQLTAAIDSAAGSLGSVVAVRIDGSFAELHLRSIRAQVPPYPPLSEVVEHQTRWTLPEARGTVIGFRFPDASAGAEVPGYHLHFLSADRTAGGHVLSLTTVEGHLSRR